MTIRTYQYQVQALVTVPSGTSIVRTVEQALGLTDDAFVGFEIETSNTLSLVDFASVVTLPGGVNNVEQDLGLSDEALSLLHPTVEQDLGLTDVAVGSPPITKDVQQNLGIADTVEFGFKVNAITVEQDLGLTDTTGLAKDFAVTQDWGLTDEARFTGIEQTLGLTDLAEWGYGFDVAHSLGLTQLAEVDKLLNQSVSHSDFLTQAVAYFIESRCNRYNFTSFHGEGGVVPQEQKLNYSNTFLIQSLDDGEIVQLRNPETDDRRRLAFNRVNRNFYDGTADIFADADGVIEETQIYTIVAIKRDKLDTLHAFLLNNLGRDVLIKDWNGVTWEVMISNPGEIYTEDSEGRWTLVFEVTGVAIDGEHVVEPWGLTDQATETVDRPQSVSQSGGLTDNATFTVTSP